MEIKALLLSLLLIKLSSGQNSNYQDFDWKPLERVQQWPRYSSLMPYAGPETTTTSSYFNMGHASSFPDDSKSYQDNPSSHYQDDSFSADFKSQPYNYPVPSGYDPGSYENYGYTPEDNFNITLARIGGFAGSGDTRGYGAYDFPKEQPVNPNAHDAPGYATYDFPREQHVPDTSGYSSYDYSKQYAAPVPPPRERKIQTDFPDLMRIGRSRNRYRTHDPLYARPLPPPL